MANGLDLVELLPDGVQPDGGENLAAPRARSRFASPRLSHAMVAVAALGGVLVADGPAAAARHFRAIRVPRRFALSHGHPLPGPDALATGPMASYHRLFVGTRATGGGVWYEPASGVVFVEEWMPQGSPTLP